MGKKRKPVFENTTQELALLSRYYPVDRENKLVTVRFDTECAEELLEKAAAPGLQAPFKEEFFETCQNVMEKFPAPYRLNAEITAQDWGEHTPQELARSFADTLAMRQNTKRLKSRGVLFLAAMFVLAGFVILGLMVCGQTMGWFGADFKANLWQEAVDISGTVFLWEAITVVFLQASEQSISEPAIAKLMACLTFRDADGTVLLRVTDKQLFGGSRKTLRIKQIARNCLLVSSVAFVVSGMTTPMYLLEEQTEVTGWALAVVCGLVLLVAAMQILGGVGGFYVFWGRHNFCTTFAKGYAFISLALVVIQFAFCTHSVLDFLVNILSCCFRIMFIVSLLMTLKTSKK